MVFAGLAKMKQI